jgi:multiple sugar transport system permease protein
VPRVATATETLTRERRETRARRRARDPRTGGVALLFTAPFFVLFVAFLFWPVLSALRTSLFDESLVGGSSWAGLANYTELLSDPNFWAAMWHTALFTLLSVPPLVLLALGLALLVSRTTRFQWLFRLAFFAPYVLPVSVVVLVWNWLYQPGFGLINSYLVTLGFAEVNWLGQPGVAMVSAVIATVWWTLGFNFVLFLAGLQEIPRELYEAAATDGAKPRQQLRRITLPLLTSTTVLVTVLQIIHSLKVFDQIYLLQLGTPGPENSTRPAIQYIYEAGFTQYRIGYASAMSFVFFLAVVAVTLLSIRLIRRAGTRTVVSS